MSKYCDGIERRDFIRVGAAAGLSLPGFLAMAAEGGVRRDAKARAAIFVRLAGGPSHLDTFDMKPGAPDTHRGEFREIETNVAGVRISEHLPKLARCADTFAILRGISHNLGAHELGTKYLLTGNRPLPSLAFPSYGAVVSRELRGKSDLPRYVAIPNEANFASNGYLGVEHGPFNTGATPRAGSRLSVRGLSLTGGVTLEDVDRRQKMLERYDDAFGGLEKSDELLRGLDRFGAQAYEMLRSKAARAAFDTTKESEAIRGLFGEDGFSQSCLLASRLVASGVRFVTVSLGGWDTHNENFPKLKTKLLPELDAGLSGLFRTLSEKGLLDSTAVFVTGEFGRTPKINKRGGRDHYPRAMFSLMAGGGVRGGQVVGASNALGEGPEGAGFTPDEVAASFYHALGIDTTKEYQTPSGRPVMIVRHGKPIRELFG